MPLYLVTAGLEYVSFQMLRNLYVKQKNRDICVNEISFVLPIEFSSTYCHRGIAQTLFEPGMHVPIS